jgi:hypothetical protein
MEENKFTKGKWTVAEFNKATVIAPHGDKGKNIIVAQCDINSLHGKGVDSDKRRESESNARLIAAAPDMYEALKDFVLWANIKDGSPSQHIRDKAIAALTSITQGK